MEDCMIRSMEWELNYSARFDDAIEEMIDALYWGKSYLYSDELLEAIQEKYGEDVDFEERMNDGSRFSDDVESMAFDICERHEHDNDYDGGMEDWY